MFVSGFWHQIVFVSQSSEKFSLSLEEKISLPRIRWPIYVAAFGERVAVVLLSQTRWEICPFQYNSRKPRPDRSKKPLETSHLWADDLLATKTASISIDYKPLKIQEYLLSLVIIHQIFFSFSCIFLRQWRLLATNSKVSVASWECIFRLIEYKENTWWNTTKA